VPSATLNAIASPIGVYILVRRHPVSPQRISFCLPLLLAFGRVGLHWWRPSPVFKISETPNPLPYQPRHYLLFFRCLWSQHRRAAPFLLLIMSSSRSSRRIGDSLPPHGRRVPPSPAILFFPIPAFPAAATFGSAPCLICTLRTFSLVEGCNH